MQTLLYDSLKDKINEARRAKHDVRHHIAVMQEYLNTGRLDALSEYLKRYGESLPDDSLIRFCENTAANAVLLYFAQQAKSTGVDYIVKAYIPSDIFVTETDISVIVGNLLENALDACKNENSDNKKIAVNASFENGMLCITVDNTYTGTLKYTSDGNIISTKHSGSDLGTQSVKNIAARYCGICRLEAKNGMFYASVLCAAKQG